MEDELNKAHPCDLSGKYYEQKIDIFLVWLGRKNTATMRRNYFIYSNLYATFEMDTGKDAFSHWWSTTSIRA